MHPVIYLGFHKRTEFSLASSAYTKGRNHVFLFFYVKQFFVAKEGPWPNGPLYMQVRRQDFLLGGA